MYLYNYLLKCKKKRKEKKKCKICIYAKIYVYIICKKFRGFPCKNKYKYSILSIKWLLINDLNTTLSPESSELAPLCLLRTCGKMDIFWLALLCTDFRHGHNYLLISSSSTVSKVNVIVELKSESRFCIFPKDGVFHGLSLLTCEWQLTLACVVWVDGQFAKAAIPPSLLIWVV